MRVINVYHFNENYIVYISASPVVDILSIGDKIECNDKSWKVLQIDKKVKLNISGLILAGEVPPKVEDELIRATPYKKIHIYDRTSIESLEPYKESHIILSITTPDDEEANITIGESCKGICRFPFSDSDSLNSEEGLKLFSEDDAKRAWEFILKHKEDIELIIVHCDAGISRSPGMGAAIAKILNGADDFFFQRFNPNMFVYRLMMNMYYDQFIDK